jgi:hypothetical protein
MPVQLTARTQCIDVPRHGLRLDVAALRSDWQHRHACSGAAQVPERDFLRRQLPWATPTSEELEADDADEGVASLDPEKAHAVLYGACPWLMQCAVPPCNGLTSFGRAGQMLARRRSW